MSKNKKIRDVVYGFVFLDEQECDIIDTCEFQRLRRIKQLSLTDMVYPGAVHTRFEHSIGVMQMATDMFDSIISKPESIAILKNLSLNKDGINRYRKIIRLAALLHDIGHSPFSHSGEEVMPLLPEDHRRFSSNQHKKFEHEDYSIAIIKSNFKDLIENHIINNNYNIKAEEVTALLGDTTVKQNVTSLLWKELISGQIDADRADYLLRDSIHLGVSYGLYDRSRLISCITLGRTETDDPIMAIEEGGWHIAESLVLARYQMFSQVYFHKVRRIYDHHIMHACKEILKFGGGKGYYPLPDNLDEYLLFDDWTMQAAIKEGKGGYFGQIILDRHHYKCIYETQLIPSLEDNEKLKELSSAYEESDYYIDEASTSWYKLDKDILIIGKNNVQTLSTKSNIVASLKEKPCQKRFYVVR